LSSKNVGRSLSASTFSPRNYILVLFAFRCDEKDTERLMNGSGHHRPKKRHRGRNWRQRRRKKVLTAVIAVLSLLLAIPPSVLVINHLLRPEDSDEDASLSVEDAFKLSAEAPTLLQLRHAVRVAPKDREAHARLGIALLLAGKVAAAEMELREAIGVAISNDPVRDLALPHLLRAMLLRNKIRELLSEFPAPPQDSLDKTVPDILRARAAALRLSDRLAEARPAIDRSLALRRDVAALLESAKLAEEQGDTARALKETDEAISLAPTNDGALSFAVTLLRSMGDKRQALARADDYAKRVPNSVTVKSLLIDLLLEDEDPRAKREIDALLKQAPNFPFGHFYEAVSMAQGGDLAGAWAKLQSLDPSFVQLRPSFAISAAGIAIASDHLVSAEGILTSLVAGHPDDRLARLQLAAVRLSLNSPKSAADILDAIKANDPAAQALLAFADLAMNRLGPAINALEMVSPLPGRVNLLKTQLAVSQSQSLDSGVIIDGLRKLLDRDPSNVVFAAPLIGALIGASQWDEASRIVDGLAKRIPTSPLPAFYKGQILVARGDFAKAKAAFEEALAIQSTSFPALYYQASVLAAVGDLESAEKLFQTLLNFAPARIAASIKLAEIYTERGRYPEAQSLLARTVPIAPPNNYTPRLALANYFIERKNYGEAQSVVMDLLQVSPNEPQGQELLGTILLMRGQAEEAVNTFRKLASSSPSAGAYALLAHALYASKSQLAAEDAARKATELEPESTRMQEVLIEIQLGGGKGGEALKTAQSYASANPGLQADLLVVDTLLRLKRTEDAESRLEKTIAREGDDKAILRLSDIAKDSGDIKKAITLLSTWTEKKPADIRLRQEYAELLVKSGDLAGAVKEYDGLLQQQPEYPSALVNLAKLLQRRDPERAFELMSRAADIPPQLPEIPGLLGWLKYQRGDYEAALPLLQRAHESEPEAASISYHLALALKAAGRRVEAKALLRATLEKNAKFEGADDARKSLAAW
jgi:putative PEP-CTERM system TPR-repeat lipoprotein